MPHWSPITRKTRIRNLSHGIMIRTSLVCLPSTFPIKNSNLSSNKRQKYSIRSRKIIVFIFQVLIRQLWAKPRITSKSSKSSVSALHLKPCRDLLEMNIRSIFRLAFKLNRQCNNLCWNPFQHSLVRPNICLFMFCKNLTRRSCFCLDSSRFRENPHRAIFHLGLGHQQLHINQPTH